jgi:hypothetical protein
MANNKENFPNNEEDKVKCNEFLQNFQIAGRRKYVDQLVFSLSHE